MGMIQYPSSTIKSYYMVLVSPGFLEEGVLVPLRKSNMDGAA